MKRITITSGLRNLHSIPAPLLQRKCLLKWHRVQEANVTKWKIPAHTAVVASGESGRWLQKSEAAAIERTLRGPGWFENVANQCCSSYTHAKLFKPSSTSINRWRSASNYKALVILCRPGNLDRPRALGDSVDTYLDDKITVQYTRRRSLLLKSKCFSDSWPEH